MQHANPDSQHDSNHHEHDPFDAFSHRAHQVHATFDAGEAALHTVQHSAEHTSHAARATIAAQATGGMRAGPAISVATPTSAAAASRAATLGRIGSGLSVVGGAAGLLTTPFAVRDIVRGVRSGNVDQTVNGAAGTVGGLASITGGAATLAGATGVAAVAAPIAAGAAGVTAGYALGRHGDEATRHYNTFGNGADARPRSASEWAADEGIAAHDATMAHTMRNGILGTGLGRGNATVADTMGHLTGIPTTVGASLVGTGASVMNAGRSGVDWIRRHLPW